LPYRIGAIGLPDRFLKSGAVMKLITMVFMLAGLTIGSAAQAGDVGLSGDVGTLGAGVHLVVPMQDNVLNARLGFNGANYSYSGSTSDVEYDFKLKLQTIEALLDWYPMNGRFHLSAGLFHNGNKISSVAKAAANGSYTINGNTYSTSEVGNIDGDIEFKSAAPYLGLGWGNPVGREKGWGFTSDMGVIFQGTPNANLTSTGCVASAQICAQFANDLSVENINLDQKTNNFKLYPVVRIGVSYSF